MDNEQRDLADVFSRPYEHGRDFWHGRVLLNHRPPRPPISCGTCCHAGYGLYPCLRYRRMPIWGGLAILSNFLLVLFSRSGHRAFYMLSLSVLILFVVIYDRLSKPINRLLTEAAKTGGRLDNGRGLQASWDRSLMIRFPLLVVSMFAQFVALVTIRA